MRPPPLPLTTMEVVGTAAPRAGPAATNAESTRAAVMGIMLLIMRSRQISRPIARSMRPRREGHLIGQEKIGQEKRNERRPPNARRRVTAKVSLAAAPWPLLLACGRQTLGSQHPRHAPGKLPPGARPADP